MEDNVFVKIIDALDDCFYKAYDALLDAVAACGGVVFVPLDLNILHARLWNGHRDEWFLFRVGALRVNNGILECFVGPSIRNKELMFTERFENNWYLLNENDERIDATELVFNAIRHWSVIAEMNKRKE